MEFSICAGYTYTPSLEFSICGVCVYMYIFIYIYTPDHIAGVFSLCRSSLPKLKPLKNDLDHLLSLIMVKARKEAAYVGLSTELDDVCKKLTDFIWICTMEVAEVEDLLPDDPDDERTIAFSEAMQTYVTNSEHHYNGAKGAKLRFQGVIGIKSHSQLSREAA